MPMLTLDGGPVSPAGETLAAGTRLVIRYHAPYRDSSGVYPVEHTAALDVTNGTWKPVGAADGTAFELPAASDGDDGPLVTLEERQVHADGSAITSERTSRLVEAGPGRGYVVYGDLDAAYKRYWLALPGTSGNYASTPDSAVLDITGDLDIRCHVTLDDYSAGSRQALVAKHYAATGNRSFIFQVNTTGGLLLDISPTGTSAGFIEVGSAGVAGSPGESVWLRVTLDADNGAGGFTVNFFKSSDGEGWTNIGTSVGASPTNIHASSAPLEVGAIASDGIGYAKGKIHRAQVYDGIDGTLVADFNPDDGAGALSWDASTTGETWTVNQSGDPVATIEFD